ncbi:MAG: DUF4129 domain-containing protein [Actinomycetes bacterium]
MEYALSGLAITVLADAPIDVGRDEARDLAHRELAQKVYVDAQPSWWERASTWAWDHFNELLDKAGGALGGAGWLFVLALVVVAIVVVIAWRTGSLERRHRGSSTPVFGDQLTSASEHRRQAELAAGRGDWNTAVIESFRELVRDLEERGALDPRPGRTADEAAREAGSLFPDAGAELLDAASTFDEVAYSDRAGTSEGYHLVHRVATGLRMRKPVAPR